MSNSPVTYSTPNGIGFFGLLTVCFIVLKLTGFIAWSWFWVLSPVIFAIALWVLAVIIVLLIAWKLS